MAGILVTGANGQTGRSLQKLAASEASHNWLFTDIEDLDITKEKDLVAVLAENEVDIIINCAAYTAVDKAESEKAKAYRINAHAPALLAKLAKKSDIALIHFSTDFVFDGNANQPYREEDQTGPLSVYGRSKLEGEEAIRKEGGTWFILRTSWVYSEFDNNFLQTMLRLGKEREEIGVVYDQVGTPTYAGDLAAAALNVADQISKKGPVASGIYHFGNEGVCSWYDFAVDIMDFAGLDCDVKPIRTEEYPTPAKRPAYSVMHKGKFRDAFKIETRHWHNALRDCFYALNQ